MAEHFKEACRCSICSGHLQKPVYLKCGYTCCLRCTASLQREPDGEGLLCPGCSVVSRQQDIKPAFQLRNLVDAVKELEPHLSAVLSMNPRLLKFQVDVTLDEDTAHKRLVISEDRKTVHCGLSPLTRRERPERFDCALGILGFPGFNSGRHYWEVDVGSSREWDVGVCRESAKRKGLVLLASDHGYWTVALREGCFFASTTSLTPLSVGSSLRRLGIFLDMDSGVVSLYNVRDGSHIFSFTKIPTKEPLRPFFAITNAVRDAQGFLSICPHTSRPTPTTDLPSESSLRLAARLRYASLRPALRPPPAERRASARHKIRWRPRKPETFSEDAGVPYAL
ncbi:ret finger protein-like 4A [Lepus europaeus]|uniref:ret finger protein-like 4A n=1 Tax=Lepus europaeus TaxID=9983 RepID=UPI002B499546|nr:ret finger protein-like 4A [Lepus europaeus]